MGMLGVLLGANYLRYLPTSQQAQFYSTVATPFSSTMSWELVRTQSALLFPSAWEMATASLFLVVLWVDRKRSKARIGLTALVYTVTITLLDGLVVGNSGYHPRHIVLVFVFTGCLLLRWASVSRR